MLVIFGGQQFMANRPRYVESFIRFLWENVDGREDVREDSWKGMMRRRQLGRQLFDLSKFW
jgi:hypothetical protein